MRRRPRTMVWIMAAVAAAIVVAALVVVVVRWSSSPATRDVAQDRTVSIPANGVKLSAEVITPDTGGRAPLLVMPASWGGAASMYHLLGTRFAQAGYQVVAYAQRGWGGSTGQADFAGPATQRDASTVIDWALQHTRADPTRIGMLGVSYGAGISLLAAAHDPRIKAVVALSTWTDVAAALDQNDTPNTSALQALLGQVRQGDVDQTVLSLRSTLTSDPAGLGSALAKISPSRSPSTYVKELNRNRPAIMIANGFEDSIFDPAQLLPFYEALTTPKRLELAPGDHGGPELAGLQGGASPTVEDARLWLDHYVRGEANGIDTQPPILLRDIRTAQAHAFSTWPAATAQDRVYLAAPSTRSVADGPTPWSAPLQEGVDSAASAGPAQYLAAPDYQPPRAAVGTISPAQGLVWSGPALQQAVSVNGTPGLRVRVASTHASATLYAYLYDVDPTGTGTLMDMAPFSVVGMRPGTATTVTVTLQPTSYTVPTGDRIALVIDAADPRYQTLAPAGTKITVSSTETSAAWLTLPIGH